MFYFTTPFPWAKFGQNMKEVVYILQIKDDNRRTFMINALIQSLKYRTGYSKLSNLKERQNNVPRI